MHIESSFESINLALRVLCEHLRSVYCLSRIICVVIDASYSSLQMCWTTHRSFLMSIDDHRRSQIDERLCNFLRRGVTRLIVLSGLCSPRQAVICLIRRKTPKMGSRKGPLSRANFGQKGGGQGLFWGQNTPLKWLLWAIMGKNAGNWVKTGGVLPPPSQYTPKNGQTPPHFQTANSDTKAEKRHQKPLFPHPLKQAKKGVKKGSFSDENSTFWPFLAFLGPFSGV